ncbi:MAG: YkuS family protein [Bacillota bacterium]
MHKIVAVDDDLQSLKETLIMEGFQVTELKEGMDKASALVVSGISNNMMQMEEIRTKAPVIDARGKSEMEIIDALKQYLR